MRPAYSIGIGLTFRSSETFERFHRDQNHRDSVAIGGNDSPSMSSAVDSPVRTCQSRVRKSESTDREADSGRSCTGSFVKFDPATQSWRTLQGCLFGGWTEFSEIWPESGTMRNGECYRAADLVPHTCDSECSLWPTPRASDRDNCGGSNARAKAKRLGVYVGRKINPAFSESLMGFPIGWSDAGESGMQ